MVNRRRNYTLHFYLMAVLVAIAIGAVNYLGMQYRTRIDLTADQRFTLSEGTQRLFEKLTEPIAVTYYVDAEPPAKRINLERDVRDKLEELTSSSAGKLQYKVERITNDEAAAKRKELEEKGVQPTIDVITSGTDERAETRGIQGYFSSIEISYGTSEPKVINGIVNLVDADDESREHRVDTLEFDIAYTVLSMRNETRRPAFPRVLKAIPAPVDMAVFVTTNMPAEFKPMADLVDTAARELAAAHGAEFNLQRVELTNRTRTLVTIPEFKGLTPNPFKPGSTLLVNRFAEGGTAIPYRDRSGEPQITGSEWYCASVYIRFDGEFGERDYVINNFNLRGTSAEAKTHIENVIWELFRPRTRLGFILPGKPAGPGQRPPQTGHSGVFGFISSTLQYETVQVDLQQEQRVPRDLACLIVVEPNQLTERELYEINQYLAEGGNVVMLVQGWSSNLDHTGAPQQNIRLVKEDMDPAFEEWAKHIGVEFGQDLLLRKQGKLQPFMRTREQGTIQVATPVRLAPAVQPEDLNASSVFMRNLSPMPLPLVVETKLDKDRLTALNLEQTDLIRLRGEVYKYVPANPSDPQIPIKFNINSSAQVQEDPAAAPDKDKLAQRMDHEPLVATMIAGEFPSLWVDQGRNIPGWGGEPEKEKAASVARPGKGTLIVMSTAAFLNTDYLEGYPQDDVFRRNPQTGQGIFGPVIDRGLTFYRNMAEAFIYGEEMVSLRARTGVAPRITEPADSGARTLWFIVCIAGMPLVLLAFAGARAFVIARDREEYEIGLGIREEK